jgi:hypothetical protein
MSNVNPPPQVRMPKKWSADRSINTYLTHLNRVILQLWQRTGGATDIIQTSEGDFSFNTSVSSDGDIKGDDFSFLQQPRHVSATFNTVTATSNYTSAPFDYIEVRSGNVSLPQYPNINDSVIVASDSNKDVVILGNGNSIKIKDACNDIRISQRGTSLTFVFFGEYWRIV